MIKSPKRQRAFEVIALNLLKGKFPQNKSLVSSRSIRRLTEIQKRNIRKRMKFDKTIAGQARQFDTECKFVIKVSDEYGHLLCNIIRKLLLVIGFFLMLKY